MTERGPGTPRLSAPILTYAARYALGRRTSAPHDVEDAIASNLDAFRRDHGCREALIRDIEQARDHIDSGALGDLMDREAWMRTLGRLKSARG